MPTKIKKQGLQGEIMDFRHPDKGVIQKHVIIEHIPKFYVVLEKARPHKYLTRTGTPGHYEYKYELTHYGRPGRKEIDPVGFAQGPNAGTERRFYENNKPLFDEPKGEGLVRRSYWYAPDQQVEPRFNRFGDPYRYLGDLRIFDPRKATPAEMQALRGMRSKIDDLLAKKWGFNGSTEQGARELDYAAASALGYDGFNTGEHVAVFKPLKTENR